MAEITFTIPNGQVARMVDALCAKGGYAGAAGDQLARREFARGVVREFICQAVREIEMQEAYAAIEAERPPIDPLTIV